MIIKVGRCTNVEFCKLATTQRLIELPDDEPFICPQCSSDLAPVREKKVGSKTGLIALQASVVVAGAGVLGWKLLLAPSTSHAAVMANAPQATAAELALAADPDAPSLAPAPEEPKMAAPVAPSAAVAGAAPAAPLPPAKVLFRLAGSDVVAAHMARRLAAGYLALIGDTDIATVPGSDPDTVQITGSQAGQREAIAITSSGSAAGFSALQHGDADIAMTIRQPNAAELAALAPLGAITGAKAEHVVGVDGVAVIVNPANKIAAISMAQLRDVVAGRAKNWSELGQSAGSIHVYAANGADSPAALFDAAGDAIPEDNDEAVVAAVGKDANGIGLVQVSEGAGARVVPVAGTADHPIAPTDASVAQEDYPLTRRLYFYNAPAAPNNFAHRFSDYALSAAGQSVVEASGFASLSVKAQAPAASMAQADAPSGLPGLVKGAERLSTTFRFQPGSTVLDNRALRDVDRLASYLRTKQLDGSHLILVGFADNTGSPEANTAVSQKRVGSVVAALSQLGVNPGHTEGFGAAFPVADNATSDGREKNRRVEAYLAP